MHTSPKCLPSTSGNLQKGVSQSSPSTRIPKRTCFLPPLLLFPLLDVTVFKAAWRSLVIAPDDGAVIRVCAKDTMSNCSSVFKSSQNGQKGLLHFLNHTWSAGPGHSNLCAAISQIPKNPSISFWSLSLKPQELRLCPRGCIRSGLHSFPSFPLSIQLLIPSTHSLTKYNTEIPVPINCWV